MHASAASRLAPLPAPPTPICASRCADVEKAVRAANLPKRTAEMLISSLRSLDSLHKKIAQSDEAAERRAAAQSDEAKDLAAGMLARLDEECKKTLARLDEEGKKTRTQSAADKNEIKSHAAQVCDPTPDLTPDL